MGIATVAVYSDLDREALHVRLADEAYSLGGETAAESYLNTEAILNALKASGADALHPGYGFYSENTDFARAIAEIGVTFIGPPPEAIEVMGDKISSRIAAEKAGVNGVPGTVEVIKSHEEVIAFGEEYGWPVAIKAAYGGGGRGMRVVNSAAEAKDALESAQREAEKAFGRSESYMERYLTWPRHVEMQVFADNYGNAIWLGERDCSCQRRHQKLIEESPAPNFPDEVRQAMGEAAVKVAKACGYRNAGTVEFLFQDGEFFFLEMNTRLQVEHPVTEMVTSLDLVELQIRVAAGEPLPFTQDEIKRNGHAIEIRINAEDPAGGKFLPSPGKITKFIAPDGFGTRLDAGYLSGDTVSQYYDNLIGKLIVWGPDRESARRKMLRALGETEIEGVATTIPAQIALLKEQEFIDGNHSTKWVEQVPAIKEITSVVQPNDNSEDPLIKRDVTAEVNGKQVRVTLYIPESQIGGSALPAAPGKKAQGKSKGHGGGAASSGSGKVAVPMQGTIVKVNVEVGATVAAGDTVCILEAMKMENAILADKAGTVAEVKVKPGDTVGTGDIVVVIS